MYSYYLKFKKLHVVKVSLQLWLPFFWRQPPQGDACAHLPPVFNTLFLFLAGKCGRWRGFCILGTGGERVVSWPVCVVTASRHLGCPVQGELVVTVANSTPPPRSGLGDHWLFPAGRAGGICPTDAHPRPDPRVRSQPAHGVQSTLQSEPEAVSTGSWE